MMIVRKLSTCRQCAAYSSGARSASALRVEASDLNLVEQVGKSAGEPRGTGPVRPRL